MSEPAFDPDALIDAMSPLLKLSIGDDSRATVKTHLEIAAAHAENVLGFALGDHEDPATVFTP